MTPWDKRSDTIVHQVDPFNAEPPCGALADHLVTSVDTFYSRNHGPIPHVDAQAWRLHVDGLVRQPLELSIRDLRARFTERTLLATLQCAGNRRAGLMEARDIAGQHPWGPGATSTAQWSGVWLCDVLTAAGVDTGLARDADAAHVAFAAPDVAQEADPPQAYGGSIPLTKALSGDVLLAWGMNGSPLPRLHGAPLRVVVPGYIGARSVKWLERVTVQREPSDNYFQASAYRLLPADHDPSAAQPGDGMALGAVALNSAILRPDDGSVLPVGTTEVAGYAYAGDGRAIGRVDVSLDGGVCWLVAELDDQAGRWAWQHWRLTVDLPPGPTEIVARAWDTSAATQPEQPIQVWNPKGYVNTSWARTRVTARLR